MDWVRARSDEQIEQRVNEIVDATARLYEANRFEDITFAMIAKEANFTRSNLYRYFQTKEEIFLELTKHDIAEWRKDVLENFTGNYRSLYEASEAWVNLALKRKRMVNLFTILFTLLEENSSLEVLTEFKKNLAEEISVIAQFLSRVLPFPSVDAASEFVSIQSSLIIGSYPMLDLTSKQKEAMQAVAMETDSAYYNKRLVHAVEWLLRGSIEQGN